MDRITTAKVKKWVDEWNTNRPEFPMTTTFNLGYVAIGHLLEHGAISVIASGETPREAWEKFSAWTSGFMYCESIVRNGKTSKLDI